MEFEEIRPYHNEELPQIFEELIVDPAFQQVACAVMPGVPFETITRKMRASKTKQELQENLCYGVLHKLIKDTIDRLILESMAVLNKQSAYTYVSNYRDITLDSGFLSVPLVEQGLDAVEIAIGDNLLIYPWIKKLAHINKCFTAQHASTMRQMLELPIRMSRYMHYTIAEKKQSIWVAQREGRAKDSNDVTQDSVLKMLPMGGDGDIIANPQELNIVPLSISYEYDPCDFLRTQEFQLKRDIPDFKRTTDNNLLNMWTGLPGYRGRVCFRMTSYINEDLAKLDRALSKPELFVTISALTDKRVRASYRTFINNYVAHDLLYNAEEFADHYTAEGRKRFTSYIDTQLERITIPNRDVDFLREKLLLMYANPLINRLAATK